MRDKLMKMREQLKKKNGFTLMELIVVIAIIGILTAALLPRYVEYTDKAFATTALSDTKAILTAGTAYAMDNDAMPTLAQLAPSVGFKDNGSTNVGKTLAIAGSVCTYTYVRGGATITGTIDLETGVIAYEVTGTSGAKLARIEKGLGKDLTP